MKNRQIKLISDIRSLPRVPLLLGMLLAPIIITLFLLFVFPLISDITDPHTSASIGRCYLLTAITLISAIPLINGLLFSCNYHGPLRRPETSGSGIIQREYGISLFPVIAVSAFLSFILVLPAIYLTDPVSTQGWLRSIYVASLLSFMAPFIFLLGTAFGKSIKKCAILIFISALYLTTIPSGLMLHHPWNYLEFFSPLYWSGWAWVIDSPSESLLYGIISLVITGTMMLILYRYLAGNPKRV